MLRAGFALGGVVLINGRLLTPQIVALRGWGADQDLSVPSPPLIVSADRSASTSLGDANWTIGQLAALTSLDRQTTPIVPAAPAQATAASDAVQPSAALPMDDL
jgi:hypothetical protein